MALTGLGWNVLVPPHGGLLGRGIGGNCRYPPIFTGAARGHGSRAGYLQKRDGPSSLEPPLPPSSFLLHVPSQQAWTPRSPVRRTITWWVASDNATPPMPMHLPPPSPVLSALQLPRTTRVRPNHPCRRSGACCEVLASPFPHGATHVHVSAQMHPHVS